MTLKMLIRTEPSIQVKAAQQETAVITEVTKVLAQAVKPVLIKAKNHGRIQAEVREHLKKTKATTAIIQNNLQEVQAV